MSNAPLTPNLASFGWLLDHLGSMADLPDDSVGDASADAIDVAAARKGDGDAFARIIRRHQSRVSRRMTRFARHRSEIAELTHDVFVEAFTSLASYRAEADFDHWLAKIAVRVGYRHWKTRKRDANRLSKLQAMPLVRESREEPPADNELSRVLDRLPPADRLVITLMYLEGHSVAEAATLAGWTQTRIKVQAFRARKKLKEMLGS